MLFRVCILARSHERAISPGMTLIITEIVLNNTHRYHGVTSGLGIPEVRPPKPYIYSQRRNRETFGTEVCSCLDNLRRCTRAAI
ncbi:hypothetical protein EVAR_57441_1 [Eumeta japonica]|uniref:Uncharacterized protein n=1 Tax=Eumeta variegata TaxID=151549 RepID=A0A4C1YC03_EUMVA|nr:hypothetical protein EVAR_57441_1 [Eumeta japonica]